MQPTLPLEAFIERCKFCDHQLNGASKHFCTTCLPPLSQWANRKDYAKQYHILRCAIGVGHEGQNKCRIPLTHPAYIHASTSPAEAIQKNCIQCGTQFKGKQIGSDHCSYKCSRVTALDKLRQGRLTRIQIQADHLFPRSDVDLTAFAALVADFLSKQDHAPIEPPRSEHILTEQDDAPIRCNMCQQPFTRSGKNNIGYSYCRTCQPVVRRWYKNHQIKPQLAERPCARCSIKFRPELGKKRRYCSTSCAQPQSLPAKVLVNLSNCADCDTPIAPHRKRCKRCQFISQATRQDANYAKRAHIKSTGDQDISWRTVGERDSWICHLCLRKVPQRPGKAKSPKGATVDHLIPLARGGEHIWENVGLAHRDCNMSRNVGGNAQLKLVS
jgi:5-methylcytosine-specific restriction endonuclease McrA